MDEFIHNMEELGFSFDTSKKKKEGQDILIVSAAKKNWGTVQGYGTTYESAIEHLRQNYLSIMLMKFRELQKKTQTKYNKGA